MKFPVIEAPATDEYANWALIKGFVGDVGFGFDRDAKFHCSQCRWFISTLAKTMGMQITGGSAASQRLGFTG